MVPKSTSMQSREKNRYRERSMINEGAAEQIDIGSERLMDGMLAGWMDS